MTISSKRMFKFLDEIKSKGFCPQDVDFSKDFSTGLIIYSKKEGYKILGFSYTKNGKTIYKDTKGVIVNGFNNKKG